MRETGTGQQVTQLHERLMMMMMILVCLGPVTLVITICASMFIGQKFCVQPTRCISKVLVYLKTKRDYFPIQH